MSQEAVSQDEYDLQTLRKELPAALKVEGVMNAYRKLAKQVGKSEGEVRRWFSNPDNQFFRKPPMDKEIWEMLEELSGQRLQREAYYPKPDFWE